MICMKCVIDCLSDNKNRTVSEVRHAFTKFGGNLGTDGSVAYLFLKQGEILLVPGQSEDAIMEAAIDAGAEDVITEDTHVAVITSVENYHSVLTTLQGKGFAIEESHLMMSPQTSVQVASEQAETLIKLLDMLEDLDDVQKVYTNAQFSDDFLESIPE